ncbi:hypothetical protein Rhe02_19040 [Rhizocola hellebori]|uniref:Uncharacterized protein n=1 Tax=Rhizocola hellebori TaxID=1392758 RepID=A0A8J3VF68_9ACTN|nr:C40 family peptidase [Rhizocola hellebori]GIH03837.1 hypothetical protein Rhe02_19040 [Rhizocola hellebori]
MSNTIASRIIAVTAAALSAATLGLVAATATTIAVPAPAYAASSIGGNITRSEILTRATNWYSRRHDSDMTYSMTAFTWDGGHTRQYRRDCSGFVGMAWHLASDPNTQGLDDSAYTVAISRSDLKPGDLLDDTVDNDPGYPFHAILFGGWEDSAKTRFWYYSFGGTPMVKVTGATFSQSTLSGHPTSQYRAFRYKKVVDDVSGTASIYGFLTDGRMTYTAVNVATGDRTHGAVVSTSTLGFVPKAMATLNFNTLLVTNPGGQLFRVDVITNNESLVFNAPVLLGGGWTHDLLAYDGHGSLFGIADGTLRRYTITATKPAASNITSNTVIDNGFTLKTLTTTGTGWILGTTSSGLLLSYRIRGAGDWDRYELRGSTWQVFDNLMARGPVYFGHRPEGSMHRYIDDNPLDGNGSDLTGEGLVDEAGWTQYLLSVQPL